MPAGNNASGVEVVKGGLNLLAKRRPVPRLMTRPLPLPDHSAGTAICRSRCEGIVELWCAILGGEAADVQVANPI